MIAIEKFNFEPFSFEILNENHQIKLEDTSKEEEDREITKTVVNTQRGTYKCEFCFRLFSRKDRLDRHLFSHTGIVNIVTLKRLKMSEKSNETIINQFQKQHKCHFEGCNKEYSCDSHLRRHIRNSHEVRPTIGTFICKDPKCGQEFTNISNMHRHFRDQHYLPYFFPCTECDSHFRRKNKLRDHLIIVHHLGNYKYVCVKCELGFSNRPTFSQHLRTHKDKEMRPCDNCELSFLKWSDLVKHRREAHKVVQTGRFSCDNCPKIFFWKKSLKVHMKIHEKKRTKSYKCHYSNCSKQYTTKSNLKVHIRSKHEGKKFKCSFCALELSTKQRFDQHCKAHLDCTKDVKDSNLSLLTGLKMQKACREDTIGEIIVSPPANLEAHTESEFSD